MYKIRDINTGLFSTGTSRYKFNKKGKIFNGLGGVRSHLNMIAAENARKSNVKPWELTWEELAAFIPLNWEIVEYKEEILSEKLAFDVYLCR